LTKNLKIFCPKSPKIVTSKGLTNQYTCIRDQIKRMPINELSIFKKMAFDRYELVPLGPYPMKFVKLIWYNG